MAALSNIVTCSSWSVGTRPFGFIARYSGVSLPPKSRPTSRRLDARPSSAMVHITAWTLSEVARPWTVSMRGSFQNGASTGPSADVDRLHPAPVVERGAAVLAADAAGLDPAEGRLDRGEVVGVDPGGAGLEPGDHPVGAGEVAGEDAGGEAEGRGVGAGDRLVLARRSRGRSDRAEDLLARDGHLVGDAGEDGRLHEEAASKPCGRARSPPVRRRAPSARPLAM